MRPVSVNAMFDLLTPMLARDWRLGALRRVPLSPAVEARDGVDDALAVAGGAVGAFFRI